MIIVVIVTAIAIAIVAAVGRRRRRRRSTVGDSLESVAPLQPMDQQAGVNTVTCAGCGVQRPPGLGTGAVPRTPCSDCGATAISVHVSLFEELKVTDSVSARLHPADQARGWGRRWQEIERELAELQAPQADGVSGYAIHAARHRLHSFYVQAYHLKDALREEASSTGVAGAAVETAVTAEPALALLADLANLDKHGALNRPPRSGHVPRIISASGTTDATAAGWRLDLEIEHGGNRVDGLTVAAAAVAAWRRVLTGWGLL